MAIEAVVTEARKRKNCAFLRFKDFRGIHIRDWKHLFPTDKLDKKQLSELEEKVKKSSVLSQYKFTKKEHQSYFNFAQLEAPFTAVDDLPEEFITGHYKEQIRNYLAWPGSVAAVDNTVAEILTERNSLAERIAAFEASLPEKTGKSQGYCSQIVNQLDKAFDGYNGNLPAARERINQTRVKKSVSDELLAERETLEKSLGVLNEKLKEFGGAAEWDRSRSLLDVYVSGTDWLKVLRPLSYEERQKQKICTLDIEVPLFDTPEARISWVGSEFIEKGKVIDSRINTLNKCQSKKIDDFEIISKRGSESSLVERVRDFIKQEKPEVIAIFNALYDLLKMREAGEFYIGEDDTRPKYEVVMEFFERIGIDGLEVVDLLRAAQTMYAYLPNKKLKTVIPRATRDEPEKMQKGDLSYKEMAEAERQKEFEKIASYLAKDVKSNSRFMLSKDYQNFSKDCCFLSRFRIPYTWLIYSSRSVKEIFKRFYFERVGTYWDAVRYGWRDRRDALEEETQLKENFKEWFSSLILARNKDGCYESVHQIYLPIGDYLRKELAADRRKIFFKTVGREVSLNEVVQDIFNYRNNLDKDNQHQFQFSRFTADLTDFMVVDFMQWHKKRQKLAEELGKKEIDLDDFYGIFDYFKNLLQSESEWGVHHLKKGTLTVGGMQKHFDEFIIGFLAKHELPVEEFHQKIMELSETERIASRMWANYQVHPIGMLKELQGKAEEIKDYLNRAGFEAVGKTGLFLYVVGKDKFKEAPFIPVDTIDKIFIADKVYYEHYGAKKAFFVDEEKARNNWCKWEMSVFGNFIKAVIAGDATGAILDLYNDLDCFRMRKGLGPEELVWYSKKTGRYKAFEKGERVYFYAEEEKFKEAKVGIAKKILKLPWVRKSLEGELSDKKNIPKYLQRFAENPSLERFGEDLIAQLDEKKFNQKMSRIHEKALDEEFDEDEIYFKSESKAKLTDEEKFIVDHNVRNFAAFFSLMVGDDEHPVEKLYRKYRPVCLRPVSSLEPDYETYIERMVGNSYEGFKHDAAALLIPLVGIDCAYSLVNAALDAKVRIFSEDEIKKMLSSYAAKKQETVEKPKISAKLVQGNLFPL